MEPHQEYAQMIPVEARLAAEGLSGQNDLRWAVVAALIKHGDQPFSSLKNKLDIHQQRLTDALDGLQTGGVIKKTVGDQTGTKFDGYYSITEFGQKILDGFYNATEPKYTTSDTNVEFVKVDNFSGAEVTQHNVKNITHKTEATKKMTTSIKDSLGYGGIS